MNGFWDQEAITLGSLAPPSPFPRLKLSRADQLHHAVIYGRTGSGKSRLLQSVFTQQVRLGHGVGILEPHFDLSFDCLATLVAGGFFRTAGAFERCVYLDWGAGFIPFNVLAGDGQPERKAKNVLEAMLRVWPELHEAPLFQTLFLSATTVLIENALPITYLYRLLSDGAFRKRCLHRVSSPLIHQAFANFDRLGRDQVTAAGSTLRRAFLLSFSPETALTLGQRENWFRVGQWMDEGRSIIVNLGNIHDGETRKLLGALILVQFEQAAMARSRLLPAQRRPFTLLLDEWPAFAARNEALQTVLSQARKYQFALWLSGQSVSQVGSARLAGALENCRINIVFGVGHDSAEVESRHIGSIDPMAVKEEPLTQTQHALYQSTLDQYVAWTQELANLSPRCCYVKLHNEPARKIQTLHVADARPDQQELADVLAAYRDAYQRSEHEAKAAMTALDAEVVEGARLQAATPGYTALFGNKKAAS